jgi:hypothetical protein
MVLRKSNGCVAETALWTAPSTSGSVPSFKRRGWL